MQNCFDEYTHMDARLHDVKCIPAIHLDPLMVLKHQETSQCGRIAQMRSGMLASKHEREQLSFQNNKTGKNNL